MSAPSRKDAILAAVVAMNPYLPPNPTPVELCIMERCGRALLAERASRIALAERAVRAGIEAAAERCDDAERAHRRDANHAADKEQYGRWSASDGSAITAENAADEIRHLNARAIAARVIAEEER